VKKNRRSKLTIVFSILLFIIFVFCSFIIYIKISPSSIKFTRPYIEQYFREIIPSGSLQFEDIQLSCPGFCLYPKIRITSIDIRSADSELVINCPQIYFDLNILSLVKGKFESRKALIEQPVIQFQVSDIYKDQEEFDWSEYIPIDAITDTLIAQIFRVVKPLHDFSSINISSPRFILSEQAEYTSPQIQEISLQFQTDQAVIFCDMQTDILKPGGSTCIMDCNLQFSNEGRLREGQIGLQNFSLDLISEYYRNKMFENNIEAGLDARISFIETNSVALGLINFEISKGHGAYFNPAFEDDSLGFNKVMLQGQLKNLDTLVIQKATSDINSISFDLDGVVTDLFNSPKFQIEARIGDLELEQAKTYWPRSLAKGTRRWVFEHLSEGTIMDVSVDFNFSIDQFKNRSIPDSGLLASFKVENLNLNYYDRFAPVTDITGNINFTASTMIAEIESATSAESKIDTFTVSISDIGNPRTAIHLTGEIDGRVRDISNIANVFLNEDHQFHMLFGKANSRIQMDFPLRPVPAFQEMEFSASSELQNVFVPNLEGFRIKNAGGNVKLENGLLEGTVDAWVNNIPHRLSWENDLFSVQSPLNIKAEGKLYNHQYKQLGLPDLSLISGSSLAETFIVIDSVQVQIATKIDITDSGFDFNKIGLVKKQGNPGFCFLNAFIDSSDQIKVKRASLKTESMYIEGQGQINGGDEYAYSFNMDSIEFGDNNFKMDIAWDKDENFKFDLSGRKISLKPFLYSMQNSDSSHSDTTIFSGTINAQVDSLFLDSLVTLSQVELSLTLQDSRFDQFSFKAINPNGTEFKSILQPVEDDDIVRISSGDAGSFFRGFNIYDHIQEGYLSFEGSIQNADFFNEGSFKGKVSMRNFRILQTPFVVQILSGASLIGIVGLFDEGGINFSILDSDLEYHTKIFQVNGKMQGPALGLTAEGFWDMSKNRANIEGTIIPINVLNGIIGNIPIVKILVDDGGIFAANYTIKGDTNDLETSVNPLSVLTPGFLRGIFDIFGKSEIEVNNKSIETGQMKNKK